MKVPRLIRYCAIIVALCIIGNIVSGNLTMDGLIRTFSTNSDCPAILGKLASTSCNRLSCESVVEEHNCPFDSIYVDKFPHSMCGCCPKCVRYVTIDDDPEERPCEQEVKWRPSDDCTDDNHCSVDINQCLPGLNCNTATKKCELASYVLDKEREECKYRKWLRRSKLENHNVKELHHWDPSCSTDGSYSPKQCKGSHYSGECFCVNRAGNKLFGREFRLKSENQTCVCSRRVHELRENHLIASLHCTADGNFEPLQCDTDSGLCYCVDPKTGELDGAVLPQAYWKLLPCYHVNVTDGHEDGRYLRKCESEYSAGQAILIHGKQHGIRLELKRLNCDFDGSYAPVQTFSTTSECVFKNGTRIGDFFTPTTTAMNCRCIRDTKEYFPFHKIPTTIDCQGGTGNYKIAYDFGSYASCVDEDGFMYGDVVKGGHICCLMTEGCSLKTQTLCYNDSSLEAYKGIKPCIWWPFRN